MHRSADRNPLVVFEGKELNNSIVQSVEAIEDADCSLEDSLLLVQKHNRGHTEHLRPIAVLQC